MSHTLTPRQAQIAALLAEGLTQQQIGDRLGISRNTVKNHIYDRVQDDGTPVLGLYSRIGVETKVEAAVWAWGRLERQRAATVRSAVGSLALSGIVVAHADAGRILAEVEREPLVSIGDGAEAP